MLQLSRIALGAAYLISFVRIPHCESYQEEHTILIFTSLHLLMP
jgi:hypothetical protein